MFDGLLHEIEKAPVICVFRHLIPDADALGSQWGLVSWLRLIYPNKKIYALGRHVGVKPEMFPTPDKVDDEMIRESLAIVLDTANAKRVDDQRYQSAKMIIQIDHHPLHENYGHKTYIFEHRAATCEIIAEFLEAIVVKPLPKKTAEYLYMGILTDTLKFSTNNTSAHTLRIAAYLAQSDLNFSKLNEEMFSVSTQEYRFSNYLRTTAVIEPCGVAYSFVTLETMEEFGVSANDAKERITDFGGVRDFEAWALFIEHNENGRRFFNGSLRSKQIAVNDIAQLYRGGGHRNAAAVKECSKEEALDIISKCCLRIKEAKHNDKF
jgi:bifunctional oligoribonuclease and PAP phosphatase NrnA